MHFEPLDALPLWGLVFTFTVVLLLIADLDRGQEGLLRVSQRSMLDLQRPMQPASQNSQP
jgi:hypothetical protein